MYARKRLSEYVDVVLTYSDDKEIFGIRTINVSNGVDAKKISECLSRFPHPDDSKIRFMACAQFNLWHGYDRAIEGLYQYINSKDSNKNIELIMVGEGASLESYKALVKKYKIQNYIKFTGKLYGEELTRVYSLCNIGLDSMGRHRSGVYYNSSLKGKEYCAYGLMIVSGVETELDHAGDFDYYFRIPADDTPVDFGSIIDFYNRKVGPDIDKVRNDIISYAINNFSIDVVFKPVIDFIKCGEL